MTNQWRIVAAMAAATVIAVIFFGAIEKAAAPPATIRILLNRHAFDLEMADTPALQARGLGGRNALASDAGMIFLFPEARPRVFWMKDMRIPIDIIWLRGGVVLGIEAQIPPPESGTADDALVRYPSPGPVDTVIELAAGRAAAIGLIPGQRVDIPLR